MIPKSRAYKVFQVSNGKLVFAGNRKDSQRTFKKLGGSKAGYMFMLTVKEKL